MHHARLPTATLNQVRGYLVAVVKTVTPHGKKEGEVMPVSEDGEVVTVGEKEEPEMATTVEETVGWHEHEVVLQFG